MIRGLYGKPYIDVSEYIDLNYYESLHPAICQGFVLSRPYAGYGDLECAIEDQKFVNLDAYSDGLKPVWYMYEKFKNLDDCDPFKKMGLQFHNNDLILYLTYAFGAHNPYKTYMLFNYYDNWENNKLKRELSLGHENFLPVIDWIDKLPIFSCVGRAYFLILEPGGTSIEHCDPSPNPDTYREFIHIRSDIGRPFYIRDKDTNEKFYMKEKAVYFNDQDFHGGDPINRASYALRIDGIFTEDFRNQLKSL
jgi:hypothetical protein